MKYWLGILVGCGAAMIAGCGSNPQTGVDEHGNAMSARVRVVDANGRPQANAQVVIRPARWLPGEPLDSLGEEVDAAVIRTNADGFGTISGLREGAYMLRAGDSARAASIGIAWRDGLEDQQVQVDSVGSVVGYVPRAAAGLQVGVQGLDQIARIDSQGRFVLAFLPKGTHRVVVGSAARGTLLPRVEVQQGRLVDLGEIPFDSLSPREVPTAGVVVDRLLAPIVLPEAGTYRDSVQARAWSVQASDSLYVSIDGASWEPWMERTIAVNTCLQFKSVRSTAAYFPIRTVCYTILR
ncbi:MAG: hypothetical protein IPN71_05820 [Fibrobacteres bacterium]|nr:hypothetical protein [Fibrobacterota bacterium]MBK9578500.1 hypothetical protein [Fibrobacterota bacterium]